MAAPAVSALVQLAGEISGYTKIISEYLKYAHIGLGDSNKAEEWQGGDAVPEFVEDIRLKLISATKDLGERVMGPADRLREMATEWASPSALRWLFHFRVAQHVPNDGDIGYEELARAAGVPVAQLKRIIRFASTNGIFAEAIPGLVRHTSLSRLLATSPHLQDYVGHCLEFSMPVAVKMAEATERYGDTEKKEETAFNVAYDTPLPMFGWLKSHPDHAERFGRLMGAMHKSPAYDVQHLLQGWDWASLGEVKVVDVGGSAGHCSIALARQFPNLRKCIVQDLEYVINQNKDSLPDDVKGRVEFMAHDFFGPQPVTDADVYLLRQVLHDWPDDMAAKILRYIVPALKKGAKILLMDQVVPEPGIMPRAAEKTARTVDLVVMSHFNGKQREMWDWERLFKEADERLVVVKVARPKGSVFAIVELEAREDKLAGANSSCHAISEHASIPNGIFGEHEEGASHAVVGVHDDAAHREIAVQDGIEGSPETVAPMHIDANGDGTLREASLPTSDGDPEEKAPAMAAETASDLAGEDHATPV